MKKHLITQMLNQGGTELFEFLAEKEDAHLELAERMTEDFRLDGSVPRQDIEGRAEELKDGIVALASDTFPAFYVRTYFERMAEDTEKDADDALKYISTEGLTDDWQEQKAAWAEGWREQGLEGTDDELAHAHVASRFGITLEEFESYVVDWRDEKFADRLETFLGGMPYQPGRTQRPLFVGLTTAETALQYAQAEAVERYDEKCAELKERKDADV